MGRMLICVATTVIALVAGGCSTNSFRVYKDGKSFQVTSGSSELKQVLCDSGDIDNILKNSELPDSLQKELKEGICASSKTKKNLTATLERMTKEQHSALKDAFRRNGYEINKVADACRGG